ncbi:MAG: hypothetical protein QM780_06875 [Hyphomicrobium sp.]|uniref:hypothetical protein n=1 Tax=Hyphomicrobium sp. TaxID=82 RepID=UPI0039E4DB72
MKTAILWTFTPTFAALATNDASGTELYVLSRCAPISVLTGFMTDWTNSSSPIFVNGKKIGDLKICDAVHTSVAPGKQNVRVKLSGRSDYGISSDAGIDVNVGTATAYVVMYDNSFTGADLVDASEGQQLLANVRTAHSK